jgi:hypothetical protein
MRSFSVSKDSLHTDFASNSFSWKIFLTTFPYEKREVVMKSVLFSLLAFAAFAAANTCTKAYYEIHAFNFLTIKGAPHMDSIYYREQPTPEELHEWYQKY